MNLLLSLALFGGTLDLSQVKKGSLKANSAACTRLTCRQVTACGRTKFWGFASARQVWATQRHVSAAWQRITNLCP
jgi:hypothetical protein